MIPKDEMTLAPKDRSVKTLGWFTVLGWFIVQLPNKLLVL